MLRVWLPLTGDLHNQGLSSVEVANTGAVVNNNGKMGKCYQFGTGTSYLELPASCMTSFTECSVAFWIKILTWQTNYCTFFQAGKNGYAWTDYIFGFLRNNNGSTVCFTIGNGSSASNSSYLTSALELNTWYHITLTYKNGKCSIYLNGELDHEYSTTIVPAFDKITRIRLGYSNGSGYQTNCLMNDVRIYDHALSPLEVKKNSQGLVLHYRLSGVGGENIVGRYVAAGNNTTSPSTTANGGRTIYNGDYSIKIPATENADTYFTIWLTEKPVDGETYTLSAKVSGLLSDTYYRFPLFAQGNTAMGLWNIDHNGICSLTFTMNYTGTINTATINGQTLYRMFMDDMGRSLASGQGEILIENIKLEKGSHPTPWCPATSDPKYSIMGLDDGIEYDCSGYGNNGEKIGDIEYSSDTPRYSGSYNILTNSYIKCGRVAMPSDEITVNIWGYMDDWSQYRNSIFSCIESGGYAIQKSGSNLVFYIGTGISGNTYITFTLSVSSLDSGWHMFSFTYDGLTACFYINGILKQKIDKYTTKTPLFYHSSNGLFVGAEAGSNQTVPAEKAFSGKISDFRVYATTLSADDILDLYRLGGSIDSTGTFHTYEYVEG